MKPSSASEMLREQFRLCAFVGKWSAICLPVGIAVGSAVALFLWSLDQVTQIHWRHPALLYLLPVAGVASALIYQRWGRTAEGGNNLIIEQIHSPGGGVPARMAPLVLVGTLITHLFGGSAGREGTAVQMGASLADALAMERDWTSHRTSHDPDAFRRLGEETARRQK